MSLDVSVIYPQKHELYLTSPLGDCTSRNIWIIHRVKCVTILFVTVNDIHREIHQISFVTLFRLHLVHVVCFGDTAAGLLTFYYELRQFWPTVADRLNEFFFSSSINSFVSSFRQCFWLMYGSLECVRVAWCIKINIPQPGRMGYIVCLFQYTSVEPEIQLRRDEKPTSLSSSSHFYFIFFQPLLCLVLLFFLNFILTWAWWLLLDRSLCIRFSCYETVVIRNGTDALENNKQTVYR